MWSDPLVSEPLLVVDLLKFRCGEVRWTTREISY